MKRRNSGFTLFELLVVIAVLAVVSTIGMQAFNVISDAWREQDLRMRLNATADNVIEALQKDFGQVVSSQLGGVAVLGEQRLEEKQREGRVSLEDDRITLPIETTTTPDGPRERLQVTYAVDRSTGARKLVRNVAPLGEKPGAGAPQNAFDGVMSLRFEYFNGKGWQPAWNAKANPSAVRLSFVVQDLNRLNEQVARTVVLPVRVD